MINMTNFIRKLWLNWTFDFCGTTKTDSIIVRYNDQHCIKNDLMLEEIKETTCYTKVNTLVSYL